MDSLGNAVACRVGAFRRRIAWVFGLQSLAVAATFILGAYDLVPTAVVIAVIVLTTAMAWFATRREWRPVRALARLVSRWEGQPLDPAALHLGQLPTGVDADVASLAHGLHGFATRLAGYNLRERNFTRDASHELRSPLTVIKMSVDMLAEEEGLSEFGVRSVRRIKRATHEMEALVDALLILARETDAAAEYFVVNDVLRRELDTARELLAGRPVELVLEEPARFALCGSPQAFSVLCWQLIRNACQQTEQGRVVVTVLPGMISVRNRVDAPPAPDDAGSHLRRQRGADRHGFELAIAQRICERFAWPLELQTQLGQNVARIRFPQPLPVDAAERQQQT